MRTDDAYPTVVARELGVGTFVNASCGGAVADDFLAVGRTGAPPQFDALDADTDLVSMTIGGNDVGFAAVIVACALRPNTAPELLPIVDGATASPFPASKSRRSSVMIDWVSDNEPLVSTTNTRSPGCTNVCILRTVFTWS